jgi:hypothetical protein
MESLVTGKFSSNTKVGGESCSGAGVALKTQFNLGK